MKLVPHTSQQLRLADSDQDEVWFDRVCDSSLVVTIKTRNEDDQAVYANVLLNAEDVTELVEHIAPTGFACAECGTQDQALTFVVTGDTEVCRACDDELRLRPVLEELQRCEELVRPATSDEDWERDDEEAELVADAYDEAAKELATATGMTYPKEA